MAVLGLGAPARRPCYWKEERTGSSRSAGAAGSLVTTVVECGRREDGPAIMCPIRTPRTFEVDESDDRSFVGFVNAEEASARKHSARETAENPGHGQLDPASDDAVRCC